MSRSKQKGTAFETLIVTALQEHLGDGVCRFPGCEDCPHPGGHDPNTPPLWEEP